MKSDVVEVRFAAEMSKDRFRLFLQHLRDFDMKCDSEIEFGIAVHGDGLQESEIVEIFNSVQPPMQYGGKLTKDGVFTFYEDKAAN